MASNYSKRLLTLFLLSKLVLIIIALISSLYFTPYVNNTDLLLMDASNGFDEVTGRFLAPFARWDAIYFLKIASDGYQFEHQHAFFPLYPLVIRALAELMRPLEWLSLLTRCMAAGVIISNVCHFITVFNIFKLSLMLGGDEKFAFLSAAFATASPAFVFLSSIYTESFFNMLITTGMVAYCQRQRLIAAVLWSFAGMTRSNGLLAIGFFIYDALASIGKNLICAIISAAGFLAFQFYGYSIYCTPTATRSWCAHRIPDLYNFVQQHYWNVRPWKYYNLSQLPNFLIAAPTVIICASVCLLYSRSDINRFMSLGTRMARKPQSDQFIVKDSLLPHIVLMIFMLIYTAVLVHVQIIARLVSFQPLFYWALAHFYTNGSVRVKKCIAFYVLGYATIGAVLFMNFYPPA